MEPGYGAQPRRPFGWSALLVEGLALGAVYKALQYDGPVADTTNRSRGHGEVVLHDVQLGEPGLPGEVEFFGMGDPNLASLDRQHCCIGIRRHGVRLHPKQSVSLKVGIIACIRV